MEKVPITSIGFAKMEIELKRLKTKERPEITKAIGIAREHGDLKENAEYHAAKDKQGHIEGRIADLEDRIARAETIDVSTMSGNKVKFGATVVIVDEDTDEEFTYQIVGDYEANLDEGRISYKSPIARALIGKEVGDSTVVVIPSGKKNYEIVGVEYK